MFFLVMVEKSDLISRNLSIQIYIYIFCSIIADALWQRESSPKISDVYLNRLMGVIFKEKL